MKLNDNPYYNPEKSDLEILQDFDIGEAYEFNMFVIWRHKSGRLYYEQDSGCSCPIPFDWLVNSQFEKEITKDTLYNFELALKEFSKGKIEIFNTIKQIKDLLNET